MKQGHITLAAAVLAATLSLSACNTEPEVVTKGPADPQADALAKAPPVQLPPAIAASRTYRCRDNSLVYVNFMTDGLTATVRDVQEGPPAATLKAPAQGEPFVAEGFELSGNGDRVTYKSPDAASQSCRA